MSPEVAIGIDLGTTNSVVAVFADGEARILPNRTGDLLRPSAVALDPKGGGLLVGRPAKEVLALRPELAAAFFKRGMGLDTTWSIGSERYGAIELSALVLRELAAEAAETLGRPVDRCVVTVPAYFDEEQRAATMKAGELAGLRVERILNEPTAAAMAYGLHNADREMQFMVVDLGGGTFDVCVMELFDGILQVKSTAGENFLGGEDFSRCLAEAALAEVGIRLDLVLDGGRPEIATILRRAELAKRRLSVEVETTLEIPPIPGTTAQPMSLVIDQELAMRAWKPLLDRLLPPIRSALRGAGLERDALDEVILVGGATRMPFVRKLVSEVCGREPLDVLDPDLAVAQGAAIQAALVLRDEAVEEIVVTDVLSHSLGVDVARVIGGRIVEGFYAPILPRNTTIPSTRSEFFYTLRDDQTITDFKVFEGESRRIEDNRFIGELKVTGIPEGPAGQELEARLTVDLNGLLELEVLVVATGKRLSRVFERSARRLSEEEIEKAKRRIARLKADPSEKPENRDVMLRAETLWSELRPDLRYELERAMDAFEEALVNRDRDAIRARRESLREICDELDRGERW